MVTHDADKAKRVQRAVVVSDGEIMEEYLARTFSSLTTDQLIRATRRLAPARHEPGSIIVHEGAAADNFYLVTRGSAEVVLKGADGSDIIVSTLHSGQYFGEIALLRGAERNATVRAGASGVEVMALDKETFNSLMNESETDARRDRRSGRSARVGNRSDRTEERASLDSVFRHPYAGTTDGRAVAMASLCRR